MSDVVIDGLPSSQASAEQQISRKIERRIVPIIFILWLVNYMDRVNVSFASIEMMRDIGIDAEAYGFGAGIFFIGYILFEMPSNMLLVGLGARFWLTRIIVTWGLVSMLQAFVWDSTSFIIVRFLLGVAEAGFLPGVLYYLTRWFVAEHRAQVIGKIMSANMIAVVIGAPISSGIIALGAWGGLEGWQWIFILEGLPAVLLGGVAWHMLRDEPRDAPWLSSGELSWLEARLAADRAKAEDAGGTHRLGEAVRQPIVWLLGLLYLLNGIGFFGVTLWLPQIIKQGIGGGSAQIGLLGALPFLIGAVTMVLNGRHSDKTRERRWHLAIPLGIAGMALLVGSLLGPIGGYASICVAVAAIGATLSVFWAIPSSLLVGRAAAGGLAMINMISGLSGFLSPWLIGIIRSRSDSFTGALILMAVSLIGAAILGAFLPFSDKAVEGAAPIEPEASDGTAIRGGTSA